MTLAIIYIVYNTINYVIKSQCNKKRKRKYLNNDLIKGKNCTNFHVIYLCFCRKKYVNIIPYKFYPL